MLDFSMNASVAMVPYAKYPRVPKTELLDLFEIGFFSILYVLSVEQNTKKKPNLKKDRLGVMKGTNILPLPSILS